MQVPDPTPLESEVLAYEEADRLRPPPPGCVLFYGSSSIRLWPELQRDFPGRPVLNRGFGGSTLADCVRYFDRLVVPYRPRVVVFYAGDNDLANGKGPQEVLHELTRFVDLLSRAFPATLLGVISVKPSPSECDKLADIIEANALIRAFASVTHNVTYLDAFANMVGPDGSCRPELFQEDGRHMNVAGYAVWKAVVSSYLNEQAAGFQRKIHKWFSQSLGREMEMVLFGSAGPRVLVFPTLKGSQFQYEELGMVEVLRDRLQSGALQLLCVDTLDLDSWYNRKRTPRQRVLRHLEFEAYVLNEVLPFSQRISPDPALTAHGCSLGAFHAVNIALRHPERFTRVLALSGRYELTKRFGGMPDLLDGYYDEDVYFNTPSHFMCNMADPKLLDQIRKLQITIVVGDDDAFLENNRAFSQSLWSKGIPHAFHVWRGCSHGGLKLDWREMVRAYL